MDILDELSDLIELAYGRDPRQTEYLVGRIIMKTSGLDFSERLAFDLCKLKVDHPTEAVEALPPPTPIRPDEDDYPSPTDIHPGILRAMKDYQDLVSHVAEIRSAVDDGKRYAELVGDDLGLEDELAYLDSVADRTLPEVVTVLLDEADAMGMFKPETETLEGGLKVVTCRA